MAAAAAAVADARLGDEGGDGSAPPAIPPARFGCQIGAGLICADLDELAAALVTSKGANGDIDLEHWGRLGMTNLTPLWLLKYLPNMLACHVTIVHDCQGPSNTITCCEASSALSLGESMRVIDRGAADRAEPFARRALDALSSTAPDEADSLARRFILPAVQKMRAGFPDAENPYAAVLEEVERFLRDRHGEPVEWAAPSTEQPYSPCGGCHG